jgi:hypothetical protein
MYRQYENPHDLEQEKRKLEKERSSILADMERYENEGNLDAVSRMFDVYIEICQDIDELSDRINFAWQDIEYDESGAM